MSEFEANNLKSSVTLEQIGSLTIEMSRLFDSSLNTIEKNFLTQTSS